MSFVQSLNSHQFHSIGGASGGMIGKMRRLAGW
jgi:hypothetical protein